MNSTAADQAAEGEAIMKGNIHHFGALVLTAALAVTGTASAQGVKSGTAHTTPPARPPSAKRGVSCAVLLVRDGERVTVPSSFQFKTGDQVALRVSVDADSYVYVLNRSFTGNPEALATRSMALVKEEDDRRGNTEASPYALVFPEAGKHFVVKAGVGHPVPPRGLTLRMEGEPGVEQLLVVVSPHPLDITTAFDPETGRLRPTGTRSVGGSDADVLGQVNSELVEMEANTVETRSFDEVAIGGGKPRDSGKESPFAPKTRPDNPGGSSAVAVQPSAPPSTPVQTAEVDIPTPVPSVPSKPAPAVRKPAQSNAVRYGTPKRPNQALMMVISLKHGDA
jgi:hypothetical protein